MVEYQTFAEAAAAWQADRGRFEELGVSFEGGAEPTAYLPAPFKRNIGLAMDAIPALSTDPNSAVPAMLTTLIDPQVYEVLFARLAAVRILGEVRKGTWVDQTAMFPVVEHTGEVSSYGDYATAGRADANVNWPQFQAYLFQTFVEVGDLELDRMGLARINLVSEKNRAAADILAKAQNTIYHFGVAGLQNYGLLNDPALSASLTPATKAAGGVTWFTAGGAPNATPIEVYNDILAVYQELVNQTGGLVMPDTPMVLALPTTVSAALNFENEFAKTTLELLKANYPNLRIETDVLYGAKTATNPQGVAGGNMMQLIATELDGQQTGMCAFNEKMRSHRVVMEASSFRQKKTSGAWGAVIRMPFAIASMIGM